MNKINSNDPVNYNVDVVPHDDDAIIAKAIAIIKSRIKAKNVTFSDTGTVKTFLQLRLAELEYEVFGCVFLDSQNVVIKVEEMFRGTLKQASVYPREVVKEALNCNAGAVVFFHNHPSGDSKPSRADETLTSTLKTTLSLIDVRVLDHLIVTPEQVLSFAEEGLI